MLIQLCALVIVSWYFSKCEVGLCRVSASCLMRLVMAVLMHLMSVCGVAGVFGNRLWLRPYVRSDLSVLCVAMFVSDETTWS